LSENKSEVTLQQYVSTLRNQIIISYDNAKEIALRNFDDMSTKLAQHLQEHQHEQPKKEKK